MAGRAFSAEATMPGAIFVKVAKRRASPAFWQPGTPRISGNVVNAKLNFAEDPF